MKKVLICKESDALETRVAMVPADIKKLIRKREQRLYQAMRRDMLTARLLCVS